MKVLFVGDLHVQIGNLEETGRIFDLIEREIDSKNVSVVVFLGDVYHTHAVLRQEVIQLLQDRMEGLRKFLRKEDILVLAGNHDGSSPRSVKINAVRQTLDAIVDVVDLQNAPFYHVESGLVLVPFIDEEAEFIERANRLPDKVLVCHQTFDGAKYENGFFAPDGFDQNKLMHQLVICGHIHTEMQVGKVMFLGTPRALNSNEYNISKGIFIFDTDSREFTKIPTDGIVKRFFRYDVKAGEDLNIDPSIFKKGDDIKIYVTSEDEASQLADELTKLNIQADFRIIVIKEQQQNKNTINTDSKEFSVESGLKQYVFEIAGFEESKAEKVWQKLKQTIPQIKA